MAFIGFRFLLISTLGLGVAHFGVKAEAAPFLWGVSNAAFQVEGTPGDSDWNRWAHTEGRISDATNADQATDFWNRYDEDFSYAQSIGLNAFRMSVSWERVEPQKGQIDYSALEHYEKMILAMRARGLEPVVTLLHFVLPGWVADQGGLLSPELPSEFSQFTKIVVSYLSQGPAQVKFWITLNEPEVMVLGGYIDGAFPPGKKMAFKDAAKAATNLALTHIESVRIIRSLKNPLLKVSIAKNWIVFDPRNRHSPIDRTVKGSVNDIYNRQFIEAVMTGNIKFGIRGLAQSHKKVSLPENRGTLDFLGINYYTRNQVSLMMKSPFLNRETEGEKNDLGWSIYPEGLFRAIQDGFEMTGLPILITENGIADHEDSKRSQFLADHLAALKKAKEKGIPLMGYLHWSLTDNFEWASGLTPRFGLIEIDYSNSTKKPRASFYDYGLWVRKYSDWSMSD